MASVKEETLSGIKWRSIERFSVQGIQFLLGLVMARLLLPSDYGTVAMLTVFFSFSQCFIDSGFNNALIRKIDRTETDYSTVFYFNIVVSLVIYAILFCIAPWVGHFFHMPILCPILRVQAIGLVLNALIIVQTTKLTVAINFKALAIRSLLSAVLSGVAGVVLAWLGFGVWALVWQGLLATAINVVFICAYCRWTPQRVFSRQSFNEMFSYGSKLLASSLINNVYNNLTPLIIGRYFSAKDLGYYNRSTHFGRFPSTNINGILQSVTFPVLAKIQNDDAHLLRVYRKYISITSMCIFFGCTLLSAVAKPLILFLLTEKWAPSVIYLQIYCFGVMFNHIGSINLNLLKVKGRSDLFLRLEIVKKVIGIAILFAAVPFGVLGICISKVIWAQVAVYINTYYTGKMFHLGYVAQMRDYAGFFFLSVACCLPAFLVTLTDIPYLVMLVIAGVSAPFLYWLCLRKNPFMVEVIEIFSAKLRKK